MVTLEVDLKLPDGLPEVGALVDADILDSFLVECIEDAIMAGELLYTKYQSVNRGPASFIM